MLIHLWNILNLNERYSIFFNSFIKKLILPFFDSFLSLQKKLISKKIDSGNYRIINKKLKQVLPFSPDINVIEARNNDLINRIRIKANEVLEHEFNILAKNVNFGTKINWHLDFNSGYEWEKGKIYKKYIQVDINNNADVKYPRELSRCHHFLILGEAYLISNDEKYTKEFINQVKDWIKENPYKKSINWGCSMDIAIRAVNWIYSLKMFINSPLIDRSILTTLFSTLYLHGRFIYEHPEKNRINNHNHYIADLAGQILIGLLFKDISKEARLWFDNGIYEFYKEIRLQILPTGPTYERSTNYHRLVTELISYTLIVLNNNNFDIPQDILYRVERMFLFIKNYLFKDGTAPIIGDQDNGRFLPFVEYNINYHGYLLSVAALLFPFNKEFKPYVNQHIDTLFLFNNELSNNKNDAQIFTKRYSVAFPDAGFYIMRSDRVYVFINNSGLSHYNEINSGTHTHSDLLSFVYEYNGIPFLIDPGTYVYSSNPSERMKFRSTYMHNTVTIDAFDQNDLKKEDLWYIKKDAVPVTYHYSLDNDDFDVYDGGHKGYLRLKDPVLHRRKFILNKKNEELIITDIFNGTLYHTLKIHFHFDEGVSVVRKNDNTVIVEKGNNKIEMVFLCECSFEIIISEEYISKSYNSKVPASYLFIKTSISGSTVIKTSIKPVVNYETNFQN